MSDMIKVHVQVAGEQTEAAVMIGVGKRTARGVYVLTAEPLVNLDAGEPPRTFSIQPDRVLIVIPEPSETPR